MLIAPIESHLADGQRLVIFPDGHLFALPFAVLTGPDGKFLVQHHSVRVAPSLGTLKELAARRGEEPSLAASTATAALVVGDPDFTTWSMANGKHLDQLSGAAREAAVIEERLANDGIAVQRLMSAEATKHNVTAAMTRDNVDLVHHATHGSANGLCFATDDGLAASARLTTATCRGSGAPHGR